MLVALVHMGMDYVWDRKLDHHFGAKVISHVTCKEDHRQTSFALPAEEGIWVGRSTKTQGADIIVPITWDGGNLFSCGGMKRKEGRRGGALPLEQMAQGD